MNVRPASGFNILLYLVDVVSKLGSLARGPGFDSHCFQSFFKPSLCVEPCLNLFRVTIIRKSKKMEQNNSVGTKIFLKAIRLRTTIVLCICGELTLDEINYLARGGQWLKHSSRAHES